MYNGGAPATWTTIEHCAARAAARSAADAEPESGGNRGDVITATSFTGAVPPVFNATAPVPVPGEEPVGEPNRTLDRPAAPLSAFSP